MAFFSLYTEKERAVESLVAGLYVQWNMLPHKDGNSDHYTGEKQWKKIVKLISRKIKWTCLNNSEKKSWLWFHEKSSRTSCQYIRMEILAAMVQARLINMRKSPPVAASAEVILPWVQPGEVAWKNSLSKINSFGWKKWIFIKIMIAMKAILRYVHICKMFIFNLKNRIIVSWCESSYFISHIWSFWLLCTVSMCFFKLLAAENVLLQIAHLWSLYPSWTIWRCSSKSSDLANAFLQSSHL